ncbi:MAG TPA: hypothetical protein VFS67_21740 [Polyangiaceae bacterium]|nr:hypothetical protein [Polyangiaceae bacterium]
MISDTDLQRLCEETYAAHFILWNVGISPEEMFVFVAPVLNVEPPARHLCVQIRRGCLQFTLPAGPPLEEADHHRVLRAWLRFSKQAKALRQKDRLQLDRMVQGSLMFSKRMDLLVAMLAKGFDLRAGVVN